MTTGMRIPPQAPDLELAVLGAILNSKHAVDIALGILRHEHFYVQAHQAVFEAAESLNNKSLPVDGSTVGEQLRVMNKLDLIDGLYGLALIADNTSGLQSVEHNSRIILEYFFKREIIRISWETSNSAFESSSDVFDLVESMYKAYDIIDTQVGRSIESLGEIYAERLKAYETEVIDGITGTPSGLKALDRITAGFQPSDLIILAARPSMGKTAFALTTARNMAIQFKLAVAFFSLEMSKQQLVDRLVSAEAEIDSDRLRKHDVYQHEWVTLHQKSNAISDAKLFIDDTPHLSVPQFRAKVKKLKKDHDIKAVFVDYLQLMRGEREKGMSINREQEISNISRSLKGVAKDLDIPVIALSQLNRAAENRPGADRRPRLADLRESGSIEQDADVVIFLFRPEYYGITEDEQGRSTLGIAETIIAKHRNGETGVAVMRFVSKFTKFIDLEEGIGNDFSNQFPVKSEIIEPPEKAFGFVLRPSQSFDENEDIF